MNNSKNIEIKARCHQPKLIKETLQNLGADYKGLDHQIDTYFKTTHGRLKLREGNIENNLIQYQRSNQQGPKQSNFTLYPSKDPQKLKQVLQNAYGIDVVVDKQRHIYFIDHVKFHIDEVNELGSFMEIEVTDLENNLDLSSMQEDCNKYIQLFKIKPEDLISHSYSDLLRK